jgi:hypothetical protein
MCKRDVQARCASAMCKRDVQAGCVGALRKRDVLERCASAMCRSDVQARCVGAFSCILYIYIPVNHSLMNITVFCAAIFLNYRPLADNTSF